MDEDWLDKTNLLVQSASLNGPLVVWCHWVSEWVTFLDPLPSYSSSRSTDWLGGRAPCFQPYFFLPSLQYNAWEDPDNWRHIVRNVHFHSMAMASLSYSSPLWQVGHFFSLSLSLFPTEPDPSFFHPLFYDRILKYRLAMWLLQLRYHSGGYVLVWDFLLFSPTTISSSYSLGLFALPFPIFCNIWLFFFSLHAATPSQSGRHALLSSFSFLTHCGKIS